MFREALTFLDCERERFFVDRFAPRQCADGGGKRASVRVFRAFCEPRPESPEVSNELTCEGELTGIMDPLYDGQRRRFCEKSPEDETKCPHLLV